MSKLTNEQWKKIEEELLLLPSCVKLLIDGYRVTILFTRITKTKNGYRVYVNGQFKGKWLVEDCEERRRFMRPIKSYVYPAKVRNKKMSKKMREAINIDKTYTYFHYEWPSFKTLKNHLIKNNENIEIVDDGQ